jgi:ABC-type transport system involved in Fe-S cluster assembly fused permease/ATPase subunit
MGRVYFQKSEYHSQFLMYVTTSVQSMVISVGTLVGALLCAYFVANHEYNLTVGDYTLFISYIQQLYAPLNIIGMLYS